MVHWFKSQQDLPAVLLPTEHSHEQPRNGVYNCVCDNGLSSVSLRKVWSYEYFTFLDYETLRVLQLGNLLVILSFAQRWQNCVPP